MVQTTRGTPENSAELKLLLQLQLDKGDTTAAQISISQLLLDPSTALFAQAIDSILQVNVSDTGNVNTTPLGQYAAPTLALSGTENVQTKIFHDIKTGSKTPIDIAEIDFASGARGINSIANNVSANKTVTLQPIPAKDKILITLHRVYYGQVTIQFVEPSTGRVLLTDNIENEQTQKECALQSLTPGFYLLVIKEGNTVIAIEKLIKI